MNMRISLGAAVAFAPPTKNPNATVATMRICANPILFIAQVSFS
jgi:hypothetical protein